MSATGRPSMSIGEVLASLQEEFSDVSVSKIRFLEAEGLIAPERTPSGYRRFSAADLDRLRLILRLQRDAFLPLKVIRERLAAGLTDVPAPRTVTAAPEPASASTPAPDPEPSAEDLASVLPDVALSESDLADAASLELGQVEALREFGVLCTHGNGDAPTFDHADLQVATIARDLLKLGIEPRHIKTLRRIAEQEADLLRQVVAPSLHNRKPEARRQAVDTLTELAELTRRLRGTYVTASLRAQLNGER